MTEDAVIHRYFVDESGDIAVFDKRGHLVGADTACPEHLMIGVAHIPDPKAVEVALSDLRAELLADPYFKGVPSMHPNANKTAVFFHAKDDVPEVRREVFRLLRTFGAKVQVAIRRKKLLAESAKQMPNASAASRKKHAEQIYDALVECAFANMLHDEHEIVVAKRGRRDRTAAIGAAIARAEGTARGASAASGTYRANVRMDQPSRSGGLQVIDYYLWAVQRLCNRGEDRFFELLKADYRLIVDLDDRRNSPLGERYDAAKPLSLSKIKALPEGFY